MGACDTIVHVLGMKEREKEGFKKNNFLCKSATGSAAGIGSGRWLFTWLLTSVVVRQSLFFLLKFVFPAPCSAVLGSGWKRQKKDVEREGGARVEWWSVCESGLSYDKKFSLHSLA